nr:hypothetical protein [Tanacetum cinerariifolium]
VLSYDESKFRRVSERAFMTLFGQDNETFTSTMFLYLGQLQNQLGKDEFQENKSMAVFWVLNNQFQNFIDWQYFLDYESDMIEMLFAEHTGIIVKQFRETLLLYMGNEKKSVAERTRHKRYYDRRMNERQMQSRESKVVLSKAFDASLVVIECSGTKSDEHITSSSSGTYITHVVDANIRPVNDQEPSVEIDSNTTPDLTNMCHRGGEIDQDVEQYQVKSPLLKVEFLKTNDMVEKEVYNELSNRFLQLEKHCISFEISIQQKEESFQSLKPFTPHYLPKVRESVFVKPIHVIASGSSRNSAKELWKPTGRIFKTVGLRWIPTGKMFTDCTTKVDSEPLNGLNDDITNQYECDQTLNVSAGLALYRKMAFADNTSGLAPQRKEGCTLQLYTSSLLNATCKKALSLLKKGLLIQGEAVEASKRRRSLLEHKIQLLSRGSSEGSGIILEVFDERKDNSCCSSSLLS